MFLFSNCTRGIGFEIARQLAKHNVGKVLITSRDGAKGKEAVSKLESEGLKNIAFGQLDVANDQSVNEFIAKVKTDFKNHPLILINNAGIYKNGWNEQVYNETLKTNTLGPIALTEGLLPTMQQHQFGKVIFVSAALGKLINQSATYKEILSSEGIETHPFKDVLSKISFLPAEKGATVPAYRLSKALLNLYTRNLAYNLNKNQVGKSIHVNAVDPGWVRTDMGGECFIVVNLKYSRTKSSTFS